MVDNNLSAENSVKNQTDFTPIAKQSTKGISLAIIEKPANSYRVYFANENISEGKKEGTSYTYSGISMHESLLSTEISHASLSKSLAEQGCTLDNFWLVKNIYFDYNRHFIRNDATADIDNLVNILNQYPKSAVMVKTHTDSRGSATYNTNLSIRRAKAVKSYLTSNGIAPRRIILKSFGETERVNPCDDKTPCTEEEHQLNRRAEFELIILNK